MAWFAVYVEIGPAGRFTDVLCTQSEREARQCVETLQKAGKSAWYEEVLL